MFGNFPSVTMEKFTPSSLSDWLTRLSSNFEFLVHFKPGNLLMIFLIFQKGFNFFWTIAVFCFITKFLISSLIGSSNTIRNHIYFWSGFRVVVYLVKKIEQSPSKLNYKGVMSRDRYDSLLSNRFIISIFYDTDFAL